jgi:trk system potassium uptake protein TrkH
MRAVTLTMTVVGMASLGGVILTHLEGGELLPRLFQSVAAIGTVGLTTTPIADLSLPSLWVVLALMYLGRVGVLSFSLAFLTRGRAKDRVKYPTCEIMIG